jgi:hypothetical protein
MKLRLELVKPDAKNRAVAPTRLANSKYRSREHLTPSEVEKLIEAAKTNRYGHRDATMLLCWRNPACASGQERQGGHAPDPGRRNARIAQAPA